MTVDTPVRYGFEVFLPVMDCSEFSVEFVQVKTPAIGGDSSTVIYTTARSGAIKSIISCRITNSDGINKIDIGDKASISEDGKSVIYSVPVNGVPVLDTDYIYMIIVIGYQGETK